MKPLNQSPVVGAITDRHLLHSYHTELLSYKTLPGLPKTKVPNDKDHNEKGKIPRRLQLNHPASQRRARGYRVIVSEYCTLIQRISRVTSLISKKEQMSVDVRLKCTDIGPERYARRFTSFPSAVAVKYKYITSLEKKQTKKHTYRSSNSGNKRLFVLTSFNTDQAL